MHEFIELLLLTAILGQDAFSLMDHCSDQTMRKWQRYWYALAEVNDWQWTERGRKMREEHFANVVN